MRGLRGRGLRQDQLIDQQPDKGVEFVDRAIGFDTGVLLGTLVPPIRAVIPLSPVLVYIFVDIVR
jgi:hypothetical protein